MGKYLKLTVGQQWIEIDENSYSSSYQLLRKNVEGNIGLANYDSELVKRGIDMWINDDGKLLSLSPNILISQKNAQVIDVIVGDVVFARSDEEGNTIALSEEDIIFIKNHFLINQTMFLLKEDFYSMKTIMIENTI